MVAHELKTVIADLQKEDPQASCSGFEQQFKVKCFNVNLTLVCNVNESKYDNFVDFTMLLYTYMYAALARTVSGSMLSRHQLCKEIQHSEEEQIQRQVPL